MSAVAKRRGKGRYFFVAVSCFAVIIALVVNVPTYRAFYAGRFPIAAVVNIHALLMASWLTVFLAQAVLASTGRLALHRRLGLFGIALGFAVWASMVFVEIRLMVIHPPVDDADLDSLLPGVYCYTLFLCFFSAAIWFRQAPSRHKRLMVFATFVALQAVEQRIGWLPHAAAGYWSDFVYIDLCLFAVLIGFDWLTLRKLHPTTAQAGALVLCAQAAVLAAWGSDGWHRAAARAAAFVDYAFQ